jgi:hypothetical protein
MTLRIVRGPLKPNENESILSQYNQLAAVRIPMQEFLHWVQDSPEGPAWHAILETDEGEIVGHTSLIPLRGTYHRRRLIAAKSEYSFIREEFRASQIQGFERSGQLKNLLYIDQLFQCCRSEGWGPLFISTSNAFHRVFRSIACYPVEITVWECLLVLRPLHAGRKTPNLMNWQRASLGLAGVFQRGAWSCLAPLSRQPTEIRAVRMSDCLPSNEQLGLSFFGDSDARLWRYLEGQYEGIVWDAKGGGHLVTKIGSGDRYLRVCQWHLNGGLPSLPLVKTLVGMAEKQRALGIRWAVYGNTDAAGKLARALRNFGFLCAQRTRTLLVNSAEKEFLLPETWNLNDGMFSFDP